MTTKLRTKLEELLLAHQKGYITLKEVEQELIVLKLEDYYYEIAYPDNWTPWGKEAI